MLNRRLLRIKAFQTLYSFSREENPDAPSFKRRMLAGLDKTFELYLLLLLVLPEFKSFLQQELDQEKSKYLPSDEQIAMLQLLANNRVFLLVENNVSFQNQVKQQKVMFSDSHNLFRNIWLEVKNHELITNYVSSTSPNFTDDKNFVLGLLEWLVADSEVFNAYMEENYLTWDDDQVLVLTTLQKTLQMLKENSVKFLSEKHKDEEEDLKFVKDLFDLCIQHDQDLTKLISAKTQNWDQERIAQVDMILMKMALCEVLYFPFVPVKVSINEYLELAKLYSTPNSHTFINGVLDKVQLDLKKNDRIKKLGRGLLN